MWAFKGLQITGGTAVMASSSPPFLLHLQEVRTRFKQARKKATWEEPCNMLQRRCINTYWWKSSFLCTIRIPGKTLEKQLYLLGFFNNIILHNLMILRVSILCLVVCNDVVILINWLKITKLMLDKLLKLDKLYKYVTQFIPAQLSTWQHNGSFKHAGISCQQSGYICIMNKSVSFFLQRLYRIRG